MVYVVGSLMFSNRASPMRSCSEMTKYGKLKPGGGAGNDHAGGGMEAESVGYKFASWKRQPRSHLQQCLVAPLVAPCCVVVVGAAELLTPSASICRAIGLRHQIMLLLPCYASTLCLGNASSAGQPHCA